MKTISLTAVQMYKETTAGLNLAAKVLVLVILSVILLGALSVAIGVAVQGAPNIAFIE